MNVIQEIVTTGGFSSGLIPDFCAHDKTKMSTLPFTSAGFLFILLNILVYNPTSSFNIVSVRQQSTLQLSYQKFRGSRHKTAQNQPQHGYNTATTQRDAVPLDVVTAISTASSLTLTVIESDMAGTAPTYHPGVDMAIFVAGLFPFLWATWEFWRRIAVGAPFGTGRDSIRIPSPWASKDDNDNKDDDIREALDMDDVTSPKPRRRMLDRGSLITAYVLFAVAGAALALTIYSVATSAPLPAVLVTDAVTDVTQL